MGLIQRAYEGIAMIRKDPLRGLFPIMKDHSAHHDIVLCPPADSQTVSAVPLTKQPLTQYVSHSYTSSDQISPLPSDELNISNTEVFEVLILKTNVHFAARKLFDFQIILR